MRIDTVLRCTDASCPAVDRHRHCFPPTDLDPTGIRVLMVCEAAAADEREDLYAGDDALFARTTIQAFRDAGAVVDSMADITALGVHVTPAVKCAKTAQRIPAVTIQRCSALLEAEMTLFPALRVVLLMGDVAISTLNAIARRAGEPRVIPAGATYRLRGGDYRFRGLHVLPSYLQAGPAFLIEQSKRAMIAEDIARGLELAADEG